jgi:hypothetical protein
MVFRKVLEQTEKRIMSIFTKFKADTESIEIGHLDRIEEAEKFVK